MSIIKKSKLKKKKQTTYDYTTSSFSESTNFSKSTSEVAQNRSLNMKQNFWSSEKIGLLLTVLFFIFLFYNYVFCDISTLLYEFYDTLFYDVLSDIVNLLHSDNSNSMFSAISTSTLFDLISKNPSSYSKQVITCVSLLEISQG